MELLLAEELLLVAYTPEGTARGQGAELDCALGGALLLELVLDGHLELDGKLVRATGKVPTRPMLRAAYDQVAGKPRRPQAWVTRLSKDTRKRLLHRMVEIGVLEDVTYKTLGVFTRHRFPVRNVAARDAVLARLRDVVLDGSEPDERTAGLVTVIGAAKLERRIFPDADRRAVQRRMKEIADAPWAARAVRKAIEAVHAATFAAIGAATAAGADGGGGGG
jgi:hypothetical protein